MVGSGVAASTVAGSNNIYIDGNGLNPADESDTIRIGNTQTLCFIQGIFGAATGVAIPVIVDAAGQLGTVISSKRFKHAIADMNDVSSSVLDLNPVTFVYNQDASDTMQFGLIAEEVDEVFPALVIKDADGLPFTVRYDVLPVLLLNEMKKQRSVINEMQEQYHNDKENQQQIIGAMSVALNDLRDLVKKYFSA
jgi:hypothetical protein